MFNCTCTMYVHVQLCEYYNALTTVLILTTFPPTCTSGMKKLLRIPSSVQAGVATSTAHAEVSYMYMYMYIISYCYIHV